MHIFSLQFVGRPVLLAVLAATPIIARSQQSAPTTQIVLHAARLLNVENGTMLQPAEMLVEGERIREVGQTVAHRTGVQVINLGDTTLLPGLIDAHVHLFLHPGAEDLQTVEESVPWRVILAEQAAITDLLRSEERRVGQECR